MSKEIRSTSVTPQYDNFRAIKAGIIKGDHFNIGLIHTTSGTTYYIGRIVAQTEVKKEVGFFPPEKGITIKRGTTILRTTGDGTPFHLTDARQKITDRFYIVPVRVEKK